MEQHVRAARQKGHDVAQGVLSGALSNAQIAVHMHQQELLE